MIKLFLERASEQVDEFWGKVTERRIRYMINNLVLCVKINHISYYLFTELKADYERVGS